MQGHPVRIAVTAGALFTILALPAAQAQAQAALKPITVTDKQSRAEALDVEAQHYELTDWNRIGRAAALREKAADLREESDVKKATSLYFAGHDRYYSDNLPAARALMVRSGEQALAVGDVIGAANAFTDAAYISADLRDAANTKYYAARAKLLSNSPMLSDVQRTDLRSRLVNGAAQRVAAQRASP
jgi:hypothetical protein